MAWTKAESSYRSSTSILEKRRRKSYKTGSILRDSVRLHMRSSDPHQERRHHKPLDHVTLLLGNSPTSR